MTIILILSAGASIAYIFLILTYIKGWEALQEYKPEKMEAFINVSIIVAFRNEEENLPCLLNAIRKQNYPGTYLEIIFADDHSSDRSCEIIGDYVNSETNGRLLKLDENSNGKKKALAMAAAAARGDLLLFTDADCIPAINWVNTVVSCYLKKRPALIAMPVLIKPDKTFFSRFQALEFLSLIGTTAGSFGIQRPIMLNGANFAIEKDLYLRCIPFLREQTSSGDDLFLLLHLKKLVSPQLTFLKSAEACVTVKPHPTIWSFIRQRLRWTSKSKHYRDKSLILSACLVFLINFCLFNCLFMSFFNSSFIFIGGVVFLAKSIVDFIFLKKMVRFFNVERLLQIFVLSQFLYFLYVSFIGVTGNLFTTRWKGREVK